MISRQRFLVVVFAGCVASCSALGGTRRDGRVAEPAAVEFAAQGERVSASEGPAIARRTGYAIASDGTRIYFEACGSGPAMVFVHGLAGNHAVWFQQVVHFARTHTVITMSQRGFAPSGGDRAHYQVALLASDLEAVLDAVSVRSAVVIGQSMGGWTALEFALRAATRVDALILADTFGGIDDNAIAAHLHQMTEAASRLRSAPPPLAVHPALSEEFSRRRPDLGYLYQTLTTFGAPEPGKIAKQLAAVRVPSERLQDFAVPTLFVVGSNDRLFPPSLVRRASGYVPGSQVVEIAGAGHSPYFEQPGAWNDAVSAFLEKPQTRAGHGGR